MKLFDGVLSEFSALVSGHADRKLSIDGVRYEEADKNQIIFRSDTAFELGGGTLNAVSGIILTDSDEITDADEVHLIGKDIPEIKENSDYARIALIKVDDSLLGEGNALYQAIRRIDYTRYHVYPKGMMLRISSMNERETVAVSKAALKKKIGFAELGKLFIDKYHLQKAVKAVKVCFITDPDFDYESLSAQVKKCEDITKALDHLLNKVTMDCHSCSLQKVCDEVEAMVDRDFRKQK